MKKTLLVTIDFPPRSGGVARFYHELCQHLPKDDIFVLAPLTDGSARVPQDSLSCAVAPSSERPLYTLLRRRLLFSKYFWPRFLPLFWHVWQVVRQHHIEHILVGQVLPVGTVVWALSFFLKIRYTVVTHAMDVMITGRSMRKVWLARHIFSRAQYVTTVSSFTRQQLLSLGVQTEKIRIIPPGVSHIPKSSSLIRTRLGWEKCFVLLTVGRIVERKGHDTVLLALDLIRQNIPSVRYLIVGSGPDEGMLRAMVQKKHLSGHVHFSGGVPESELASYYEACDVFVMLPRKIGNDDVEGFGIVFLEAALFEKPVLAARSGGVEDAVIGEKTGILVSPEDINAAAFAIYRLFKDPILRQRLGKEARNRIVSEFTWEQQAKKFSDILGSYVS